MSEFTDELRAKLNNLLLSKVKSDKDIHKLRDIIKNSTTYEDAYAYALRYSEHLADSIQELGVDSWLFGTAVDAWEPSFQAMVKDINKACETIQTNKNALMHIGINPQIAPYNELDMREVVRQLTVSPDARTNIKQFLENIVEEDKKLGNRYTTVITNYANNRVDDIQRANMNFLINSGLRIRVTRIYDDVGLHTNTKSPIVCQWCKSKEGTFTFSNTYEVRDSEVFARHEGCGCLIDYDNRSSGTRTTTIRKIQKG